MSLILKEFQVLDAAGCAAVLNQLLDVRPAWTRRHPDAPFFTLGAASYLDASRPAGSGSYVAIAERSNPVLAKTFAPLQAAVVQALEKHLGQPVQATTRHALPGFHIFGSHPAFERPVAMVHVDLQHHPLDFGVADNQALPVLTFTLPIQVPSAGAGLDCWEGDAATWVAMPNDARVPWLKTLPHTYYAYQPGVMLVHDGSFPHRIAPGKTLGPDDARITYHGHAVYLDGAWELYW